MNAKSLRGGLLGLTVLILALGNVPVGATECVFSTAWNQYGDHMGQTILDYRSYHSESGIHSFGTPFLPHGIGLDALSVDGDGRVTFSVIQRGFVSHAGGTIHLEPDRVYLYDPANGVIQHLPDWSALGIQIGGLDAIDRLWNGRIAFSTEVFAQVTDSRRTMLIYPENIYQYNPNSGRIRLMFDGRAFGIGDLDALDVLETGRIVFSTATSVFVSTPRANFVLRPQNAYQLEDSGNLIEVFNGRSRNIESLDGIDLDLSLLAVNRRFVHWSETTDTSGVHDLVRGSLTVLRSTGDLTQATELCLASNTTEAQVSLEADPTPGEGWWFLQREAGGTYDTGSTSQPEGRDMPILLSGVDCP